MLHANGKTVSLCEDHIEFYWNYEFGIPIDSKGYLARENGKDFKLSDTMVLMANDQRHGFHPTTDDRRLTTWFS